jgi:SdrD B-like domain/Cohesin domain
MMCNAIRSAALVFTICVSALSHLAAMPPGTITGRIFSDYNFDGIDNDNGPGIAGATVLVYNDLGLVTSVLSGLNGAYTVPGLVDGTKYRVEFSLPVGMLTVQSTVFGAGAKTTVQFVTAPSDNINQGFSAAEDFCQPNPLVLIPCYISGNPLLPGTSASSDALVAVPFLATGQGQGSNTYVAKTSSIGTVSGIAFQRESKLVFLSSVLKRHSGFGPGGTGAIYLRDVANAAAPIDLGWFSLDSLGIDTGTDPRIVEPLPINKEDPSFDSLAYPLVGKMSFGDMAISNDGKYLFVVNLFDKTLYRIFINYPYVKPSAADVTAIPFVNPGCVAGGDWSPWGLKMYRGELYAGLVCTAESTQDATALAAHVVKLTTTNTWAPVTNFPLTFSRGVIIDNTPAVDEWYPWTNNPADIFVNFKFLRPQPILSDIEFDVDGSMILGFSDRMGIQGGYLNYGPTASQGFAITTFGGGDIIRVCNIGGSFVLEGTGTGCQTTIGSTQAEGPNGKEYYWSDAFADPSTNATAFRTHNEIALGSLTMIPGTGVVLATIFDPYAFNTNGFTTFDNTTGARTRNYEIFPDAPGFFGKASGLGSATILCNPAPIEKGNYVWKDIDKDGVQDPGEPPIAGVNVSIVSANCSILATTQTNAAGEYYFNSTLFPALVLAPSESYSIVVGNSQFNTTTSLLFDSLTLTVVNTGLGANSDLNDSDGITTGGCIAGLPHFDFITTAAGAADHTCDFGFYANACDLQWMPGTTAMNEVCRGDANGSLAGVAMTATGGVIEYAFNNGAFGAINTFSALAAGTYALSARLANNTTCFIDTMMTVAPGLLVESPTNVLNDSICQYQLPLAGQGLMATPIPCTTGIAVVRWYGASTGGTVLGIGTTFNPVLAGLVNTNTPGVYTYYAEGMCGTCVSVRVPAVFTVNAAPVPVITGNELPCPGETVTYTTTLNAGSTYVWNLVGTGSIIGTSANTFTVLFPDSSNVAPIQIVVTETNLAGCTAIDTLTATLRNVALTCSNNVQLSLGANCCAKVLPQQVLSGTYPAYDFTVTIKDAAGNALSGDSICGAGTFTYTVTESCKGNSCWGTVRTEDKLPPVINCQPVSVPCTFNDTQVVIPNLTGNPVFAQPITSFGGVVVNDNCGLKAINHTDDYIKYSCDTLFGVVSGILIRIWSATDVSGNIATCKQVISFLRQPVTNVVWPRDTVLSCQATSVLPAVTGMPTLAGIPLGSSAHSACDLDVTFSDNTQQICDGTRKILRNWTLLNWCQPVNTSNPNLPLNPLVYTQLISVKDTGIPQVTCPIDLTVSTEYANCLGIVNLPDVIVSDACSRIRSGVAVANFTTVNAAITTFAGNNLWNPDTLVAFGSVQGLEVGEHPVIYNITDDCGNVATCSFKVNVIDGVAPQAVCKAFTKVSLSSNGTALVNASSFDNGSYDNCAPVHFKVRRMNTSACVPNNTQFDDQAKFCCSDIGDTVLVVFRAYDRQPFSGAVDATHLDNHSNDCMVRILVEDKLKPNITCPANITVNCNTFDPSFWSYGQAVATDNCGLDTITSSANYAQFDSTCDNGVIRRTFTATDNFGNSNTCTQRIQVNRLLGFTVRWPDDITITRCNAMAGVPKPVFSDVLCGLPAMSYTDERLYLVPDACYKIIRKWRVEDFCEDVTNLSPELVLNPANSPLGPTSVATGYNHGYIEYNQIIKVIDTERPTIVSCPDTLVIINDLSANDPLLYNNPQYNDPIHNTHDLCEAPVQLEVTATDACSGADIAISYTLQLDLNGDGTKETTIQSGTIGSPIIDFNTIALNKTARLNASYQVPHGRHRIIWLIKDGCGNETSCAYDFLVRDAKAPTMVCKGGIAVNIMQTGMIDMWISDVLQYGQDNCTPTAQLVYGIRESDTTSTSFPTATSVQFDCSDLGTKVVRIYGRDKAGNADYCETYILVQDNIGACNAPKANVGGALKTEVVKPIDFASVKLTGSQPGLPNPSVFTNSTGLYNFNAIPVGNNYSISVQRGDNWLNGVNMLDVLKMQRHILGLEPLATPYKLIAADVNRTGSVTSNDMVVLRKLILGAIDTINGGTSWRFVDKKHVFTVPNNPFNAAIPEVISIANLQAQISNGDFVGVKTGDVTGDAIANAQDVAGDRQTSGTLVLVAQDQEFAEGETFEITLAPAQIKAVEACQFTIKFNTNLLQINDILPNNAIGMSLANCNMSQANNGMFSVAYHNIDGLLSDQSLFTIRFTARAKGSLKGALSLSNEITPLAAFDAAGNTYQVALQFGADKQFTPSLFEVFQNTPNPFRERTQIGVALPAASQVVLTIFDATGHTLYTTEKDLPKGLHNFEILSGSIPVQGLLYYRVESAFGSIERKMIHVNR